MIDEKHEKSISERCIFNFQSVGNEPSAFEIWNVMFQRKMTARVKNYEVVS